MWKSLQDHQFCFIGLVRVELILQKLFGDDLLNSRREVPLILKLDSKYNDLIWHTK